ncbi:MAG: hypothetical protein IKW58_01320 [Alphaproteobacteria bacterium]|nr:hypothetical protein [Alphaproteobacteria bacterium]
MKIKLSILARLIYVFSVLLFLVSFVLGQGVANLILWVSIFGLLLTTLLGIKRKTKLSSKMTFFMFLSWMLSVLVEMEGYCGASIALSSITIVLACCVLVNSIIYINKYCQRDVEKMLK